jgi:phosphoribosylformimino-5-aminoimidazole carboxamide ribotide isomerase
VRIIPAIDIIDGKCVRLSQGDYAQKTVYNENPLEVAKQFEDAGLRYLHLVDLDGAKARKVVNWKVLEAIVTNTGLKVDFGGGLRTTEDVRKVLQCGAAQITAGSIAVSDRDTVLQWLTEFGAERIILGADAKDGRIATHGWLDDSDWMCSVSLTTIIVRAFAMWSAPTLRRMACCKGLPPSCISAFLLRTSM